MGKSKTKKDKKSNSKPEENPVIPVNPSQPVTDPILSQFDKAKLENQIRRHSTIGNLFDKAAEVIENYLDDPSTDLSAKMFPAKLATDIYLAQEKFAREDERIEIEKRKLTLEEIKVNKQLPPGSKFIQNNNYYPAQPPQSTAQTPVDIGELKKRQEELLSGYLGQGNEEDT